MADDTKYGVSQSAFARPSGVLFSIIGHHIVDVNKNGYGNRSAELRMGKCTGYYGNLRVPVQLWTIATI